MGRPAVIDRNDTLTYGALSTASTQLAGRLAEGTGPVGVLMARGAAAMVAMVACIRAGRPFFPSAPDSATAQPYHDAGVTDVVCAGAVPTWWRGARAHRVEFVPEVAVDPCPERRSPECGYLVATSGTTGTPKIIRGSSRSLARYLAWQRTELALAGTDVVSNTADPWFDFSFKETLGALVAGATVTVVEPAVLANGGGLLGWLAGNQPTVVCLLPSRLAGLVEAMRRDPEATGAALTRLRLVLVSGEPFPVTLLRRWRELAPGPTVLNLYGPTESTVIKLRHVVVGTPDDTETVPVGVPVPGTTIELVATVDGSGAELCLVSDDLALGYLHGGHGSTRFDRDSAGRPRLRTGDLARLTAAGEVELLGRADHTIKRRGLKVPLPAIEAAALRHPQITWAAAVWCRGSADGRVVLFYATGSGTDLAARAVRACLLNTLPPDQLPDQIRALARWPMDGRGKTDRGALRALVTDRVTE